MKRQKYPKSVIKVGAVLYRAVAFSYVNKPSSGVDMQEWVVTSIQKKKHWRTKEVTHENVNLCHKVKDKTWVKRSRKHFDWGWAKSISAKYREQFRVGNELPWGVFTTKLQALKFELWNTEEILKAELGEDVCDQVQEVIDDCTREIRVLKSRITKVENEKKKSNKA